MKKFFAIVAALVSVSAFADHTGPHMVTLSGYNTGNADSRSLDVTNSTGGSPNTSLRRVNLNYAYAISDMIQIGGSYKSKDQQTSGHTATVGDKSMGYGVQVIYNFSHRLHDTNYLAVHYDWTKIEDPHGGAKTGSKVNTWGLEFGRRFSLGNLWGMNFNYSPSATLAFNKTDPNLSGADSLSTTDFNLNFVKFDVLF